MRKKEWDREREGEIGRWIQRLRKRDRERE